MTIKKVINLYKGLKIREKDDYKLLQKKEFRLKNISLNVSDINQQIKYSFKSKRITNP